LKNVRNRIYKTIILPVVLYGCETWSVSLREEHRLKVIENRAPRRILAPKKEEVMGRWRKLHNEELRDLYSSPTVIKYQVEDEVGRAYSANGGERDHV
jgi:hypothetical protein